MQKTVKKVTPLQKVPADQWPVAVLANTEVAILDTISVQVQ